MSKTCIVCGMAAGSGEHVFPAALGGRRINRNIYCTKHDNGYSSLVGELANQLDVFNALLGVIPDHGKTVKSVVTVEPHTGQKVRLSAEKNEFLDPRVISQRAFGDGVLMDMGFPNHESMKIWIAEQEAKGLTITKQAKAAPRTFFFDDVHHRRAFGGACGLGAVAYVTQTLLAQEFPEVARSGALSNFIAYTQAIANVAQKGGCKNSEELEDEGLTNARQELEKALSPWGGEFPVWWDFDEQPDATANRFAFGHRVTVGVDAEDGQIYGRLSFFSTLQFSMCFGTASSEVAAKAVTVDINPLAEYQRPDHDVVRRESASAATRVNRPASPAASLAESIGGKESIFSDLLERLTDHALKVLAKEMHSELAGVTSLSPDEADELFHKLIDDRSQQVWNVTKWVVRNSKGSFPEPLRSRLAPILDSLVAHDPNTFNGLSATASTSLELAKAALVSQMKQDSAAGILDERRVAALMGEGPGAAIIGKAVLSLLPGASAL